MLRSQGDDEDSLVLSASFSDDAALGQGAVHMPPGLRAADTEELAKDRAAGDAAADAQPGDDKRA